MGGASREGTGDGGEDGVAPSRKAQDTASGFEAQAVRDWIADDPDPATREELARLLAAAEAELDDGSAAARAELADRFSGPLEFGTAGLRGEIAGGPHRMNRAVVIKAAAGLSTFLREHTQGGPSSHISRQPGRGAGTAPITDAAKSAAPAARTSAAGEAGPVFSVVIGCDARHGSADFAHDTAAVVAAAGGLALLLPRRLPTPLLAFAVQHMRADAGVMVTASHNPPRDNGYKVYLGLRPLRGLGGEGGEAEAAMGAGAQIVPPADALIAERIAAVESVAGVPRAECSAAEHHPAGSPWDAQLEAETSRTGSSSPASSHAGPGCVEIGEDIVEAYLAAIDDLGAVADPEGPLRIVTTSLHGVGGAVLAAALERAGLHDVRPVGSQRDPDPDFPTVAFPNPEEAGALDEAIALAEESEADLVIANDPDADRFSAAVPAPDGAGWRQLSGDEVGLLLGEAVAGRISGDPAITYPVFASSIVSSRGLAAVAASHGIAHRSTLTGFKWISRVPGLVYGYEEALGYCVNPVHVRDKDGISAAVLFASFASQLKAGGSSVLGELTRIRARDGVFRTQPLTFRLEDTALIAEAMSALRREPPEEMAGAPLAQAADLALGYDELAPTDGMLLLSEAGDRVIVRPSGTEPKLKCYLEAVEPVPSRTAAGVESAWQVTGERLDRIAGDLRAFFRL